MNHYKWCEQYGGEFFEKVGINPSCVPAYLTCDGDKCYQYSTIFEENGIPFVHGVLIYIISKDTPYCNEVRQTRNGWVDVCDWIVSNYRDGHKFIEKLPTKGL